MSQKINIILLNGYNNAPPTINITIDGLKHTLEREELTAYIVNVMEQKGYTTTKTKAQKIPRVHLNH